MTLSSFWVRPRSRRRETSSKAKSPPKKLPANTPEISSCHRYLEKHGACVGSISSTAYRRFCGIAQVLQHPFATRDLVQSMGKAKHAKYSMDQILHSNRFNDLDIVLADWYLSKLVNLDFTMRSYLVNANTRISYWRPPPTNYRQRTIIVTWVHSTPVLPPPVYVTVRHVQNTFANGFSMTKKSERILPLTTPVFFTRYVFVSKLLATAHSGLDNYVGQYFEYKYIRTWSSFSYIGRTKCELSTSIDSLHLLHCKRLTQGTVSKIPQTVRPRVALQLDQETAYLAGCRRVVHQLVRGWTSACPRGCASDSPKASPQGICGLFTRYYLCNMSCLQGICVSCLRVDIL